VNASAIRPALVLLAVVVGVWLVFGLRSVLLIDDGDEVLAQARSGNVSAEQVDAAMADYARAGRFSPDQTPLIDQGALLYAAGRQAEAEEVARRATEVEPDNLQAWYLAWVVAPPNTPAKAAAERRVLALNPWFEYALQRARLAEQQGR
jgi:tetratricopeptide (TPR) repeat protein